MANHEEMVAYMLRRSPKIPFFIEGQPGIGKSEFVYLLHESLTTRLREGGDERDPAFAMFDMASKLPEDFTGGMKVIEDLGVTRFFPMEQLKPLLVYTDGNREVHPHGVMGIDDGPAADPSLKKVMFAILGPDRTVSGHRISDNVYIVVTGNSHEHKAGASQFPSPVLNRMEVRTDLMPDTDSWGAWMARKNAPAIVPAFIKWRPELLIQLPKDADKHGRFGTPRSWFNLSCIYEAALKSECLAEAAQGCVGEGPGMEFQAFAKLRESIDPEAILDGKQPPESLSPGSLRDDPGKAVGLASALAEAASRRIAKAAKAQDNGAQESVALNLLTILATMLPGDYAALGLRHFYTLSPMNLAPVSRLSWSGKLENTPAGKLYTDVCESFQRTAG